MHVIPAFFASVFSTSLLCSGLRVSSIHRCLCGIVGVSLMIFDHWSMLAHFAKRKTPNGTHKTVAKMPSSGVRSIGLARSAEMVVPVSRLEVADADDNGFLECALDCRADYLITGNKRHFPNWTIIVTPREFVGRESK
jgi:hypothetical protein